MIWIFIKWKTEFSDHLVDWLRYMFNVNPNFDPSLPYWADLIWLWLEEWPKWECDMCGEWGELNDEDVCEECESLSSCCGAPYIGETTLCSDCKEYG